LQHDGPSEPGAQVFGHDEQPVEPPELLELEPELEPPELDPLGVMQSEPTHDLPEPQTAQGLPPDPQLLSSAVPGWQVPEVSQQPEHVDEHVLLPELEPLELLPPLPEAQPASSPVGLASSPEPEEDPDPDDDVVASSPPVPDELP
jgi:hypothetical protein